MSGPQFGTPLFVVAVEPHKEVDGPVWSNRGTMIKWHSNVDRNDVLVRVPAGNEKFEQYMIDCWHWRKDSHDPLVYRLPVSRDGKALIRDIADQVARLFDGRPTLLTVDAEYFWTDPGAAQRQAMLNYLKQQAGVKS